MSLRKGSAFISAAPFLCDERTQPAFGNEITIMNKSIASRFANDIFVTLLWLCSEQWKYLILFSA